MASDLWHPKIDRYVDGELSVEEMRALEAHLRECPSCSAEALRQVQQKRDIGLAARRYTPSPQFRLKIAEQLAPKKVSRRWLWTPALAAVALLLIASAIFLNRWSDASRSRHLLAELTDIHVANLAASSPVDVISSDRHTVKPWFQGKVPFTFSLPELQGTPFTLAGGRLTYLDHEPGALLIYNVGGHHISVFIFRDQPELSPAFSRELSTNTLQFHIESWAAHDLRYFIVGDASDQSIQQLAGLLKKAANP
jgi:anti-sigma factor RsiW